MIEAASETAVLRAMRRILLAILAIVMIGSAADLLLLNHYEEAWQLAPLVLIALGSIVVAACALSNGWMPVLALRVMMVLFIAAGALGMMFHYSGSQQFQRELDPSQHGWPLFVKTVTAKAPPALAPAVMIQMGMLGLLYSYKHPALDSGRVDRSET
jgi:hypothetical protein